MSKPLIIVESPTKVRTLNKYIGKDFRIAATSGHILDLPPREMGIDIQDGFKPQYTPIRGKQKIIKSLKDAARGVTEIYLAPDPDREGEAIAFHTAGVLDHKDRKFHRILFHELTRNGIRQAIEKPLPLNRNRYDAQQARRILDRLVGYEISPLLWRKVQGGLSAGRVQSVALRIICERERAIQAFEPEEYWSITAHLACESPPPFPARLVKKDGEKIQIPDESSANDIIQRLSTQAFIVDKIVRKTIHRNPLPPFITSTLQQDAIRRLRFSAKKTMSVAQQLYEGIDLGPGEPVGLITYMRTDSTRIAIEAADEAREHITAAYGEAYAIPRPRFFQNKNKIQDAHEAIRPTSVFNTPEKIARFLNKEQIDLYRLIWNRFVASQMAQALIDQVSVSILAGVYTFSASGSTVKFPGFMALYQTEEESSQQDKDKTALPDLRERMPLECRAIEPKQHFTQPPPRFTEASLVKELEENGIGRPSTYATILSTIQDKGYVNMNNKQFHPSELGFIVNDLLVENFPDIFNVDFTARLETDLDRIETAELAVLSLLNSFYEPFIKGLKNAQEHMQSIKGVGIPTPLNCPDCGKHKLHVKIGKNGPFLACNGYPECGYSRNYTRDEKGQVHPVEPANARKTDEVCEKCGKPMVIRQGRYGEFMACSGYPQCKNAQSIHATGNGKTIGAPCPEKDCKGEIVERTSKRGKLFYGCTRFPECGFASWDRPVTEKCPNCGSPYLVEKTSKREGIFLKCPSTECGYKTTLNGSK